MNRKYKNGITHDPAVNLLALTSNTLVLLSSVRSDNPLLGSQWRNANASKQRAAVKTAQNRLFIKRAADGCLLFRKGKVIKSLGT